MKNNQCQFVGEDGKKCTHDEKVSFFDEARGEWDRWCEIHRPDRYCPHCGEDTYFQSHKGVRVKPKFVQE